VKALKIASVISCLAAIVIVGCNKIDTTDIGTDLIPPIDNISTFETILPVVTDNRLFNDSTRMLDGEDHAIGIIENDPEFGRTVATSYISFTPSSYRAYPFVKRDTVVIDSVVLSLNFTSLFGDSMATQQFEVREIDNRFVKFTDSLYYLNPADFAVTDKIGGGTVSFQTLDDSVFYRNARDTVRQISELRLHLDTSWARRFVNYDTTSAYQNDTLFKNAFAGVEIRAAEGTGTGNALAYFSLGDNSRTRITFYCRVQNNGRTDTIAPYFQHTSDPQANIVRRTPGNNYLTAITNTADNDELLYIQSTPGSYATVDITGMDTVALTNRIVHRAELIFEKYPSIDEKYTVPPVMFVDAVNAAGDSAFTIRNDFMGTTSAPGYDLNMLGGVYRNGQYVFNLSRYVQSIITKKFTSYRLRIYAPFTTEPYYIPENSDVPSRQKVGIILNTPVAAGRVVLYGGGSTSALMPRLRIIWSKL